MSHLKIAFIIHADQSELRLDFRLLMLTWTLSTFWSRSKWNFWGTSCKSGGKNWFCPVPVTFLSFPFTSPEVHITTAEFVPVQLHAPGTKFMRWCSLKQPASPAVHSSHTFSTLKQAILASWLVAAGYRNLLCVRIYWKRVCRPRSYKSLLYLFCHWQA